MTECSHVEEKLSAYMDGELGPEDTKNVERHLARCGHCAALLADLRRTKELVQDLEEVEPPPWLSRKIMAGLSPEAGHPEGLLQRLFRPFHIKIPLEALAACLVAVLAVYVYKATGPEISNLRGPVERPAAAPGEFAPAPERKAKAPPEMGEGRRERETGVSEGPEARKEREYTRVPDNERAVPPDRAEKPSRALPQEGATGPVKPGITASGAPDRKMESAESVKSSGSIPTPGPKTASPSSLSPRLESMPAPSAAPTGQAERSKKAGSDRRTGDLDFAMPQRLVVRVAAGGILAAAERTESQLKRLGAKKIARESRENLEIIEAELPARALKALPDALSVVGRVEDVTAASNLPEVMRAVRIEIKVDP